MTVEFKAENWKDLQYAAALWGQEIKLTDTPGSIMPNLATSDRLSYHTTLVSPVAERIRMLREEADRLEATLGG